MGARPGQMLSHYRLVEKVGEGGMGVVWKADDTILNRPVAIKILPSHLALDEERQRMFMDEARLAASLSHGNIVQVFEIDRDAGLDFIVMEYVDGKPLNRILHGRPLPPDKVVELGLQIARGLARAHRQALIHRDLKPANILVTPDGDVKIVDFGLAALLSTPTSMTDLTVSMPPGLSLDDATPNMVGTLPYMSPEQVQGSRLDARSDIFSLGSVLYEMTCGRRPFPSLDPVRLVAQITSGRPLPVHELAPDVPIDLSRIIEKCLAHRPADRYQHTDEIGVDLKRLGRELESGSSPSYRDLRQAAIPGGRSWRWLLLVSGVVLTLVVVWSVWLRTGFGRRARPIEPIPTIAQLVTWPGEERSSRISPDGLRVAFIATKAGRQAVWIQDLAGGEPRWIAAHSGNVIAHAWSPSGGELAVVILEDDEVYLQFYPAMGGAPRASKRVDDRIENASLDRWYGSSLYLFMPTSGLWRFDLKSDSLEAVIGSRHAELGFIREIDICANERTVAITTAVDGGQALWMMDLDTRDPVRLSEESAVASNPRWIDEDCRTLLYSSTRAGHTDLWKMSISDRVREQITFSTSEDFVEDVTTNGSTVTFREEKEHADLWVLDRHSLATTQWTADQRMDLWPSVSDSGLTVFQRSKSQLARGSYLLDAEILRRDTRATDMRVIVSDGFNASVSPDGAHIAFTTIDHGKFSLWIADSQTGHKWCASRTFSAPSMYVFPFDWVHTKFSWSPNSDRLYFVARGEDGDEIQAAWPHAQDSESISVGVRGAQLCDLHTSPNGTWLAYTSSVVKDRLSGGNLDMKGHDAFEARVLNLDSGETHRVFETARTPLAQLYVRGWLDDISILLVEAFANDDYTEGGRVVRAGLDGSVTHIGEIDRAFVGAAKLDSERSVLYFTGAGADGTAHNIHALDLSNGSSRQLTNNQLPGVTYSGLELTPDARLLYARYERDSSIGVIRFTP